jgi:hypothetical protein
MATTKKPPASKNEVAIKKPMGVALISERIKAIAEANKGKVEPAGGNTIRATQDKKLNIPGVGLVEETDVVILEFCSTQYFYSQGYNEKNIVPPDCFAIGNDPKNLVPSPNSPNMQVAKGKGCNVCPNFQWGSGDKGEGKACKSGRRAVVLPADDESPKDTPLMVLNASPTAIKGFDGMIAGFTRMGAIPPQFKIHVDFNPAVTHASLRFSDPRPNEDIEPYLDRLEEAEAMLKVEPDVTGWADKVKNAKPAARGRR